MIPRKPSAKLTNSSGSIFISPSDTTYPGKRNEWCMKFMCLGFNKGDGEGDVEGSGGHAAYGSDHLKKKSKCYPDKQRQKLFYISLRTSFTRDWKTDGALVIPKGIIRYT